MHPWLARKIYLGLQRFRGEPVVQALKDVRRTEFFSLESLKALQAERLLAQLRFTVQNVPYYSQRYAPFAVEIRRAKTWDDAHSLMNKLPPLTKETVQTERDRLAAGVEGDLRTHPDKTSGSTGTPIIFPCDQKAWAYRHALTFRCMEAHGVRIGEPYAYLFGLHWNNLSRFKIAIRDLILNRVRISAFEIGSEKLHQHLAQLTAHQPTHIVGYPSAVYEFCVLLKAHGLDHHLKELSLKGVFLTAEPLRDYQRRLIEMVSGSKCINMYGSAEGGVNALECPQGSLHLQMEASWLQIKDPNSGSGEALVTDLMLRAFPMIRYEIGDEVTLGEGRCSCGRAHPILEAIEGRAGEPIVLPNGRKINANLPSYIFKPLASKGVIRKYRFLQKNGDEIQLYLVVTEEFDQGHMDLVKDETYQAFGSDIPISFQTVDELPHLPNAKHRDYIIEE